MEITYNVPLAKLKGIYRTYLASPNTYSLASKVPKIFMKVDLFRKSPWKLCAFVWIVKSQFERSVHKAIFKLFDVYRRNYSCYLVLQWQEIFRRMAIRVFGLRLKAWIGALMVTWCVHLLWWVQKQQEIWSWDDKIRTVKNYNGKLGKFRGTH